MTYGVFILITREKYHPKFMTLEISKYQVSAATHTRTLLRNAYGSEGVKP